MLLVLALVCAGPAGSAERPQTPSAFGGPGSTGADLAEDATPKVPYFRFDATDRLFAPYLDAKERLNEEYGFAFGGDYSVVYQHASETSGRSHALAGMLRLYGTWTLLPDEGGNTGSLVYKLQHNTRLGNATTPFDLGFEAGSILPTKAPWSDQGWLLTNLFWQQRFLDGRFTVVAGQLDVTDYVDIYGLVSPWSGFSNLAFLTNPTIAAPNQGLGMAVGGGLTDNLYFVAGIADANGNPEDPEDGFDGLFAEGETFQHLEVGWSSSWDRRYLDNLHVTAWHADERTAAGVPGSWGVSASAAWFVQDRWMPFLRAGWSDGGAPLLNGSVSVGVGYLARSHDLLAIGFGWGEPSARGLDDQYTFELFYRLQLTEHLAVTPDLQLIADPALDPDESVIWVPGLRLRLTF